MIQAIVLWDRLPRRILTWNNLDLVLLIPFLTRHLLGPFRNSLLGGHLEHFDDRTYYHQVESPGEGNRQRAPDNRATDGTLRLRKTIVLRGQGGLGKTMLLCHLAATTTAIPIFLDALHCEDGVSATIQNRLKGFLKEDSYLSKLIWGGAVEIYIDRLDSAPETTQEKIRMFMENNSETHMVVATRPPLPPAATPLEHVFELLPLRPSERTAFLARRQALAPPEEARKLVKECERYIEGQLEPTQSPTVLAWTEQFLCNPRNLDALAAALKAGAPPNHLIDLAPKA